MQFIHNEPPSQSHRVVVQISHNELPSQSHHAMAFLISLLGCVAALALTNASPTLSPRGKDLNTIVDHRPDLGGDLINFAPNWPTCGNDKNIKSIGLSTTITVKVRPDCDTVIDKICVAAAAMASRKPYEFMIQLSHTEGTCEGHMLFSYRTLSDPLTYDICVRNFQSITNTCMLMDDPTVKNLAAVGEQAGVQNILWNPTADDSATYQKWSATKVWNQMPGYMMGPKGYFGKVVGHDSSDITADGFLKAGA